MAVNTSLTIGTFNILLPQFAVKYGDQEGLTEQGKTASAEQRVHSLSKNCWQQFSNWDQRAFDVKKNIEFADIMCLQEVCSDTVKTLSSSLVEYEKIYFPHESDQVRQEVRGGTIFFHTQIEYGNAIFYRKERWSNPLFNALVFKYIECEDQKKIVKTRKATRAFFDIPQADGSLSKKLEVVSVHLSGYNPKQEDEIMLIESKKRGYNELKTYLEQMQQGWKEPNIRLMGSVVAGDFNEDTLQRGKPFDRLKLLTDRGFVLDADLSPLYPSEPKTGRKIDHIAFRCFDEKFKFESELPAQVAQASDHLMVRSKISLTN